MKVYAIDLSLSSYTVKARNLYFPRDCLLSRNCVEMTAANLPV